MRKGSFVAALLAAVTSVASAAQAMAAGRPAWFPAPPFGNASEPFVPRVAESRAGETLFSWVTKDGTASHAISIAELPSGPGTPSVLSSSRGGALADAVAYSPAIALANTGDALVAWKEGPRALGLRLRQAPADFGDAIVKATPDAAGHDQIESPVAADADSSGRFTVAYGDELPVPYSPTGNLDRILVWDVDAATGLISGPVSVAQSSASADTFPITDVALAVASDGHAVMAFRQYVDGSNYLDVTTRDSATGAWSSPSVLDFSGDQPRVAIQAGGRALVAWRHVPEFAGGTFEVRGAERAPGGFFAAVGPFATGTLSDASDASGEANVRLDAAGSGTVVWQTCTGCGASGAYRQVLAQRLTVAGALDGSTQTLSGHSLDPAFMNPQLAVTPAGAAVVVWKRLVAGHSQLEYARRSTATAPFAPAAQVPAKPEVVTPAIDGGPELAVDAAGDAAVAWEQDAGMGEVVPHLARLDASPPVAGSIAVVGRALTAFVPLTFSLSPHDTVSTPTVRWTFGDGGRATGTTVSHLYRVGGPHTVTATVTDGAGYTAAVSRVVALAGGRRPRFVGHPRLTRLARGRVRISWQVNVAARVRVSVVRLVPGHRRRGHCTTQATVGRRCTVAIAVVQRRLGKSRRGSVVLKTRGWTAGRYRATLRATSSAGRSPQVSVGFNVG